MAKRYFFIPLLTAALLCMACDDPPVKTYTYQDLTGSSPTTTIGSFLGTYSVTEGYKDLFEGKPFAISFWATDATNATNTLVRITPLSTGTETMVMYRGTYSASATSATLSFTKLGMDYSLTAVPSFDSTKGEFTLKNSDGTKTLFTTNEKLDDYLMRHSSRTPTRTMWMEPAGNSVMPVATVSIFPMDRKYASAMSRLPVARRSMGRTIIGLWQTGLPSGNEAH